MVVAGATLKQFLMETHLGIIHDREHLTDACNITDEPRQHRYFAPNRFFKFNGKLFLMRVGGFGVVVRLCSKCCTGDYHWFDKPHWMIARDNDD